jgi:hypothetical protein
MEPSPLNDHDREELLYCREDPWDLTETEHSIRGSTYMDNFNMEHFLELIGVNMEEVHFEGDS